MTQTTAASKPATTGKPTSQTAPKSGEDPTDPTTVAPGVPIARPDPNRPYPSEGVSGVVPPEEE